MFRTETQSHGEGQRKKPSVSLCASVPSSEIIGIFQKETPTRRGIRILPVPRNTPQGHDYSGGIKIPPVPPKRSEAIAPQGYNVNNRRWNSQREWIRRTATTPIISPAGAEQTKCSQNGSFGRMSVLGKDKSCQQ